MSPIHHSTVKEPVHFVEFFNVTCYIGTHRVLDTVSLTIPDNEHVAILGPNGSGKSSLIKAVIREIHPVIADRSVIWKIWGRETWDVFELRSRIGIVSADLASRFFQEMTGREMILSGFFSSVGLFHHLVTPDMQDRADKIADLLEISHLMDRMILSMSYGEARRFLIGRALVHNPRVLILDEPAGNLDLYALHLLRQTLRTIARSGTCIILVTHALPDIIPEISRVIMMQNGRIWCDGKKEELLTSETISTLFCVPVTIHHKDGYYYATGY